MTTLKTRRLTLKPPRIEDFDAYAGFYAEAEKCTAFAPHNLDRETVWARLLRWVGHWDTFGYGAFLAWRDTVLVGEVGIAFFKRGVSDDMDASPEAFWRISPDYRRVGLAKEAMAAVIDWADTQAVVPPSVCMIDLDNDVSLRFAQSFGFAEFARGAYKSSEMILLRRE